MVFQKRLQVSVSSRMSQYSYIFQIYRPGGIKTGLDTFKHIHDKSRRSRDYARYGAQKQVREQVSSPAFHFATDKRQKMLSKL